MTGFIIAFIAVLLAGLGARDQLAVAALTRVQGSRPTVLVAAVALCLATAQLAGWLAQLTAPMLGNSNARLFLAALALGFAGIEALVLAPGREVREPTNSLAALIVVLTFLQLTDAARFLIFGIALAAAAPMPAVLGGAAGGVVLLTAAWASPEWFTWQRLRPVRRTIGAFLLAPALWLGLRAMGLL
jgi:Ca2+/H+ antiporter, TMEM165/GDT1 family